MTLYHLEIAVRRARSFIIILLLAGCSSSGGDWSQILAAADHYWNDDDNSVSVARAGAIPYATIGLRVSGGPQQILILAMDNGHQRLWSSAGHVSLLIGDGRILATSGFGADLSARLSDSTGEEPWLMPHTRNWIADFADLGRYSVQVKCDVRPAGLDPIAILGQRFDTVRVNETCRCPDLDWSFENTYWVSRATQRVWRSIQQAHPNGPQLEIEYLRPPIGTQ